jgi:pyridoxamine 5'-phosphate oxidase
MPDGLDEVFASIWNSLEEGCRRGRHPWHTGVLATTDGDQPDARIVVLRGVDRTRGEVVFHTDCRSPKWRQLSANPEAAWVFYDAPASIQIRLRGTVKETDAASLRTIWQNLPPRCLKSYATLEPPGTPIASAHDGLDECWRQGTPPAEANAWAAPNLAVLRLVTRSIDHLSLAHSGHRRALFTRGETGAWRGTWVVP